MLPKGIAEYKRQALRLALGVGLPSYIGFAVLGPEHHWSTQTICKWAAITAAIVGHASPLIGKATQVGFERALGTVLGGLAGFLYTDGTWLSLCAAFLAACSILVGQRFKLNASARLFTITFLLVTFSGDAGGSTLFTAFIRVSGIVAGVAIMLALSVLVMPKSATVQCLHDVDSALKSLHQLYYLVWKDFGLTGTDILLPEEREEEERKKERNSSWILGPFETTLQNGGTAAGRSRGGGLHSPGATQPLLANESGAHHTAEGRATAEYQACDVALLKIYEALWDLEENIKCAKSEVLLSSDFFGSIVMLPGLPLGSKELRHLPEDALLSASLAIRRAAKVLSTLGEALEASREVGVMGAVPGAETLLGDVARAGNSAILEVRDAFPKKRTVGTDPVLRLLDAIKAWESAAGEAALVQLQSSHWYRRSNPQWTELENAMSSRTVAATAQHQQSLPTQSQQQTEETVSIEISQQEEERFKKGDIPGAPGSASPPPPLQSPPPPSLPLGDAAVSPFAGTEAESLTQKENDLSGLNGAYPEWHMLSFNLRQLVSLGEMHEQLFRVMRQLPFS